jgi:DNA-binding NarL/FixJ family response regulator
MGLDLAKEQYPDVIICNLDMPSLKRDDILKKLREYPETDKVHLILLTGDNTISSRRLSQNLGGNISLLKKSLRLSEILQAILIKIVDEPITKTIGD